MKHLKTILGIVISMILVVKSSYAVYAANPYLNYGSQTGNNVVKTYSNTLTSAWTAIVDLGIIQTPM